MYGDVQNNKLLVLGKLAASLAHEIRNPLSALKLNLDYLTMCKDDFNVELMESIEACKEAADRIQTLMENTLDFARRSNKEISEHSIIDIFYQTKSFVEVAAKKKNVSVLFSYDEAVPNILVEKSKILQVFVNLLHNAIEASSPNSEIEVSVKVFKTKVVFEVKDYGIGIKEEDKAKIFSDFYTNKETGTGLGLSVCKMLLNEFNAKIDFESKEGEGSRFFIEFPQKSAEESE